MFCFGRLCQYLSYYDYQYCLLAVHDDLISELQISNLITIILSCLLDQCIMYQNIQPSEIEIEILFPWNISYQNLNPDLTIATSPFLGQRRVPS